MTFALNRLNPFHVPLNRDLSINQKDILIRTAVVATTSFLFFSQFSKHTTFVWRLISPAMSSALALVTAFFWFCIDRRITVGKIFQDVLKEFSRVIPFVQHENLLNLILNSDIQLPSGQIAELQNTHSKEIEQFNALLLQFIDQKDLMDYLLEQISTSREIDRFAIVILQTLCFAYRQPFDSSDVNQEAYYLDYFKKLVEALPSMNHGDLMTYIIDHDVVPFAQFLAERQIIPFKNVDGEKVPISLLEWDKLKSSEMGKLLTQHYDINQEIEGETPLLFHVKEFLNQFIIDDEVQEQHVQTFLHNVNFYLELGANPKTTYSSGQQFVIEHPDWVRTIRESTDTSAAMAFLKSCIDTPLPPSQNTTPLRDN